MSDPNPSKKQRGCFFYGCITCLVLALVIGLTAFFVARYAINRVNALIVQYTDTSPMTLPKADMPSAELEKLKMRVAAFKDALDAHTNTPPLIFSAQEFNAWVASAPQMKAFKDKFYVSLEGDRIKGQVSLPLEEFKIPLLNLKGRYLNGAGTFKAAITNAMLFVTAQSLEVKGKPLPAQFMSQLQAQNLAENADNNPTNTAAFNRFESVEVRDGSIIVKAKKDQ